MFDFFKCPSAWTKNAHTHLLTTSLLEWDGEERGVAATETGSNFTLLLHSSLNIPRAFCAKSLALSKQIDLVRYPDI
jgi:hypothetical protein